MPIEHLMAGLGRRAAVLGASVLAVGASAFVGWVASPSGAAVDTTAPQLAMLAIAPTSIDTSGGPAALTVDARITDDLSGPSVGGRTPLSRVEVVGPGGQQRVVAYLSHAQRISGTALDGIYRATIMMPWHAEPGRWNASAVLYDTLGNTRAYTVDDLHGAGLADGVTQVGAGDTVPPTLVSVSVAPLTIDTALQSQTIAVSSRITDDLSGVASGLGSTPSEVILRGPTGAHRIHAVFGGTRLDAGDALDGSYVVSVTVPRWSEQGTWTVEEVRLLDEVGNLQVVGAPGVSFVQSGIGDVIAPRFASLSILSASVDVRTAAATIGLRARLVDDVSGVADGIIDSASEIVFRAPSGHVEAIAEFGLGQRTSGNAVDGWYEARVTIPAHAEPGTWTIGRATAIDRAHNARNLGPLEWSAALLPGSFGVVSDAPPWGGPTVPPTGVPTSTIPPPPTDPGSTTTAPGGTTSSTATTVATTPTDPGASTTTNTTAPGSPMTTTAPPAEPPPTIASGPPSPPSSSGGGNPFGSGSGAGGVRVRAANGYWFATESGAVSGFGGAAGITGSASSNAPVVGMASTPTGNGYWLVTAAGAVHAFGDAPHLGSMAGQWLSLSIVGIASTPTGRGYWLVASDGGIFAYGDAAFFGSTGAIRLNKPVVGMTATPSGRGYWFVASDGGIFAYGDAAFFGSTGSMHLNQPVVGMTGAPGGSGYWLVARDGGIFAFGDAPFFGSTGSIRLAQPIVGMAATPSGRGYWFVAADGGIFAYGDAGFFGSLGADPPPAPVVAMAARAS
ncbi:MAG: hypothetical protein ACT4OX_08205 [Actinomycetota bacterium]